VGPNGKNPDGTYNFTDLQRVFDLRKQAGMVGGPLLMVNVSVGSPPELQKATMDLAKKNGFTEVYFYGADEASGDTLRNERAKMKRTHDVGGKTFAASPQADSFRIVGDVQDLLVLGWPYRPSTLARIRAYHSVGSKIMRYSNPFGGMEVPETFRRNYGFQLWKGGWDGGATYAYQHSLGHGWDDFDADPSWPLRDLNMAYPTVNGVIPTLQWEGYREGYDDLRYVATLENLIEKNLRLDGPAGEAARAARLWLLLMMDPSEPDRTPDEIRARLVNKIVYLKLTGQ
jgi:hypothetical protein